METPDIVSVVCEYGKISSSDLRRRMGWSPQRFWQQRKRGFQRLEHLEAMRAAVKMPVRKFWASFEALREKVQ